MRRRLATWLAVAAVMTDLYYDGRRRSWRTWLAERCARLAVKIGGK